MSHVINFDAPEVPANYIHRIGRTGRADKKGNSITFVTDADQPNMEAISALMKYDVPILELPEEVEISDVLTEDEMPKIKMKTIRLKDTVKREAGPAFHEKSKKNQKVNLTRAQRKKYREINTIAKRKARKKGKRN